MKIQITMAVTPADMLRAISSFNLEHAPPTRGQILKRLRINFEMFGNKGMDPWDTNQSETERALAITTLLNFFPDLYNEFRDEELANRRANGNAGF